MSASYNEIMKKIQEKKKNKQEGFTNKSSNNIANKRRGEKAEIKKSNKDLIWGHFVAQTVHIIVYFWIFFPFWSYQLQIILDQANCGPPMNDPFGVPAQPQHGCRLPWQKQEGQTPTPYAPTLNAQSHVKPVNIIKETEKKIVKIYYFIVKCIHEIIHVVTSLYRRAKKDIVNVAEEGITLAEGVVDEGEKVAKKVAAGAVPVIGTLAEGAQPELAPLIPGIERAAEKALGQSGGAYIEEAAATTKRYNITSKDIASTTGLLDSKLDALYRSGIPPVKQAKHVWASKLAETVGKAACCKDLKKQLDPEQLADCDKQTFKNPLHWLFDMKKFGWPYDYIFDSEAVKTYMKTKGREGSPPKAYNPHLKPIDGIALDPSGVYIDSLKSWKSWIMAWFAETQLKAWSRNRWLTHTFLYLFYPFIHRPLTADMVHTHYDNIINDISGMLGKIHAILHPKHGNVDAKKKTKYTNIKAGLEKYQNILRQNKLTFRKKCHHHCDIKTVLFETLKGYIHQEVSAINAYKKTVKGKGSKPPNSFFIEFYMAALKPLSLRQYKGHNVWWKWCEPALLDPQGAGFFYWGRYLVTLCMPFLMSTQMYGSFFLSIVQTVFAAFNRYSIFWLPLIFAFVPIILNMFVMPMEMLYYLLIGPSGSRNNSKACPYTGGMHQMKENIHTYWPLNLFICLGTIITHLGSTLLATKTGPPALGGILTAIFPTLIIVRLLVGLVRWLIRLFKSA